MEISYSKLLDQLWFIHKDLLAEIENFRKIWKVFKDEFTSPKIQMNWDLLKEFEIIKDFIIAICDYDFESSDERRNIKEILEFMDNMRLDIRSLKGQNYDWVSERNDIISNSFEWNMEWNIDKKAPYELKTDENSSDSE